MPEATAGFQIVGARFYIRCNNTVSLSIGLSDFMLINVENQGLLSPGTK